jgi:hypothetical protein
MIATRCRNCGAPHTAVMRVCRYCGARNNARIVVLGLAALMIIAVVGGMAVLWRGPAPWAGARNQPPAMPATSAAGGDYGWLNSAMAECDAEAAKAADALEFLVIPLKPATGAREQWRKKSINNIGNAILLPANDAIEGLKRAALSISDEPYVFSLRDDVTGVVYKWSQSVGVKKFINTDADAISRFNVQFQAGAAASTSDWGSPFFRDKGTCYWVNAILGN